MRLAVFLLLTACDDARAETSGALITDLATVYDENNWQLYNPRGDVHVTDRGEAREAAPSGHGPAAPWDLCAESELGDACAWESAERDLYRGTCRSMSGALVCVRNQPIIHGAARQRARWVSAAGLAGAALIGALAWRLRRVRAQRFSTCS